MRNAAGDRLRPDEKARPVSEFIIDCQALGKNYGSTQALADIDLQLQAGPPIALIGPNGAGKTTFLSLVCGFIRPSSGSVSVLGHRPGSSQGLRHICALPQDAWMDPAFSIERQLRHYAQLRGMAGAQARNETARVLDLVQLSDRGRDKPGALSHGMRKRIMIAQALIGQPKIVMLDEPTAGIDPPNIRIIRDLISSQAANATFIISSHNLDELEKVCSTVVHLKEGRLQGTGSIDSDTDQGVLSITLRAVSKSEAELKELFSGTAGVTGVTMRSGSDLIIEYDSASHPNLDIALLQMMADNNIAYRRLTMGQSLEDQLFA